MRHLRKIPRRLLCGLLATVLLVQSVSCGTLLYPERIGQTRGPLDPAVVALDTVGLLLFVVPGAIAFAVDFYNGTIYLPTNTYRGQSPDLVAESEWESVKLPAEVDTQEELQDLLKSRTGHPVVMKPESVDVYELEKAPTEAPVELSRKQDKTFFQKIDWKKMLTLGIHKEKASELN
ncbi:MAG: hypothetical protein HUJ26_12100 [Planctomycetaceae bacterium]|nr:hypothetical protein [Planctomycetaceae bacterium]